MQTKLRFLFLFAIATLFIFSSCKKSNKQGRYIPKTAAFVLHINGESVTSKLPWEEVKQNELFKSIYQDTSMSAYLKSAFENPDNTGINIKNDLLIFVQKDSAGDYTAIQGTIKDAAKFKEFNSKVHNTAAETEKEGIHFLSNKQMTASWNKEKFVIVMNVPENQKVNRYRLPGDSIPDYKTPESLSTRDLNAVSSHLFSLKEDNSLAKDEKFSELMNTKGDIHFWINAQSLSEGIVTPGPISMINMGKLYEGSLITGTASFDNGQINADIKSYAGKEMTMLWKKYSGTKISNEMVKRISSKDIALLVALNFKPEGLREFIKIMGLEGFVNMGTTFLGFTMDDFIKAIKGDILLSVSDITRDTSGKTNATVLFSSSIADKASFDKLIDAGKKIGKEKFGDSTPVSFFYNTTGEYFAIGNNKQAVDGYIQGSANSNFSFLDKISGSPISAYINFQYIMNTMKGDAMKDNLATATYEASLKIWDNLVATGGKFKDGGISQHIEINLLDKTTNSLKQLNNYLGTIAVIDQKRKTRPNRFNESIMGVDSTKTK